MKRVIQDLFAPLAAVWTQNHVDPERELDDESEPDDESELDNGNKLDNGKEPDDESEIEPEDTSRRVPDDFHTSVTEKRAAPYLSAEEKVERYLSELSDDRSWQTDVMEEMSWSAAKTSRVLCAMEECERIGRYRVGKEKCVYLPGSEPEALTRAV